jgi:large subunit ribosomal protein L23
MKNVYQVIKGPLVTEKTTNLKAEQNKVAFKVDRKANKHEIKTAIEQIFKVKVTDVRTMIVRGKKKRYGRRFGQRPDWKKAIVTLKQGDTIDFFEGA